VLLVVEHIVISIILISVVGVHIQVGAIKPGGFKVGNTGGMLDNILSSKLYRAGRLLSLFKLL